MWWQPRVQPSKTIWYRHILSTYDKYKIQDNGYLQGGAGSWDREKHAKIMAIILFLEDRFICIHVTDAYT
jgi:hypothetical protein